MSNEKISLTIEINSDSEDMLDEIIDQYDLPDASKAIRCMMDYVSEDGDWEEIFGTIRCIRC